MKTRMLLGAIAIAVLLVSSMSLSQTRTGDTIVNVPFSFVVANQELPPGRYAVTRMAEGVLRISASDGKGVAVPVHSTEGKGPEGSGKVVFHRYGDTYFLSEVWNPGSHIGEQVFRSKAEKEVEMRQGRSEIAVLRTRK
jgi:hypothetical protein